jgi:hypothetical protein
MRTIAHLYDSYDSAQQVVSELEAAGFSHDDVSIVANHAMTVGSDLEPTAEPLTSAGALEEPISTTAATAAGTGASIGTIIGGGAGLLTGLGLLAIPGVGPVVAAGWLVATLAGAGAGAAAGGLLGSLTGAGVPEEHAHVYAEGVRRGSALVTVRAEDSRAMEAEAIMGRYYPVDVAQRAADYRTSGDWSAFDETRGGMTAEELEEERLRITTRPGL